MADAYLLDTSALVARWLPSSGTAAVSTLTLAELQFGALKQQDPAVRAQRLRAIAQAERTFLVHAFTPATAAHYGELAAAVAAAGRNPRPRAFHLQIAATAKEHGLILVTANPGDLTGAADLVQVLPI